MKIKTRDQKIAEYNEKYPDRETDALKRIETYFNERGWDLNKACKKASAKASRILEERKYESIYICMYEYPMKTDRPRTANGHTYSPNAAANKNYFNKAIKKVVETTRLITTPAEIYIDAYLEMPSQVPPDEVILFEAGILKVEDMPDYDNIGKCYTDMLKDTLISDDDIFYKGTIEKWYSILPRVEIMIRYLVAHESDYIYRKLKNRKSIKEGIESGQIVLKKLGE